MIRLNVFISVEPQNRAAVLSAAKELTAASIQEEGCVAYDIFESATRETVLMFCETWKDEETLTAHQQTACFLKNIAIVADKAKFKIEKFDF